MQNLKTNHTCTYGQTTFQPTNRMKVSKFSLIERENSKLMNKWSLNGFGHLKIFRKKNLWSFNRNSRLIFFNNFVQWLLNRFGRLIDTGEYQHLVMGPYYMPHQKKLHIIIGFLAQGWFFFQKSSF